jgi:hypothetical protein
LKDSGIESADIRSLQLLLSGGSISIVRSQFLLSAFFGNANLERQFLGCSKADVRKNLSDLESADLSVEALDSLLLSESVSVESEDALLRFILKLGPGYRDLLRHIEIGFLSEDGLSILEKNVGIPPESLWQCAAEQMLPPPPPPFDSRIISDFPEIFAEFRGKRFSLLWRGSRDGFVASEFHRRCDGHANTLTVILDTKGNIFGGFTPVEWESRKWNGKLEDESNTKKADDSLKSFVFMLKNQHNVPARRFALNAEEKHQAIVCNSRCSPCFGGGYDIYVFDNCNADVSTNWSSFGSSYINNTGLDGTKFFAGSKQFQVKEIEVFEITD